MSQSPARLNSIANDAAADVAEVAFHDGDPTAAGLNETAIPRQALTYTAAPGAGLDATQVGSDGRSWSQLFDVVIPAGTTVTYLSTRDAAGDVLDWWEIPPMVGPLNPWRISIPIVASPSS